MKKRFFVVAAIIKRKTTFGGGLYYSYDYNYQSFGLDAAFSEKTNSNGEVDVKGTAFSDKIKLIYPSELVPAITTSTDNGGSSTVYTTAKGHFVSLSEGRHQEADHVCIPSSPSHTYSVSLSFSHVFS